MAGPTSSPSTAAAKKKAGRPDASSSRIAPATPIATSGKPLHPSTPTARTPHIGTSEATPGYPSPDPSPKSAADAASSPAAAVKRPEDYPSFSDRLAVFNQAAMERDFANLSVSHSAEGIALPSIDEHSVLSSMSHPIESPHSFTTFGSTENEDGEVLEEGRPVKGEPAACLFVASLNAQKTDDQLTESVTRHFIKWGRLLNVKVMKDWMNRPYAFVQYSSVEDALRALDESHDTVVDSRHVRVEQARVNRTLFLAKLSRTISPAELRSFLEKWGRVEDVTLLTTPSTGRPKGCAFAKFRYREDAIRAFLHIRQQGKWSVEWAANIDRQKPEMDQNAIFVGGLNPAAITEDALRRRFEVYGPIESVDLFNDADEAFAFLRFEDSESAHTAISTEHGREFQSYYLRVHLRETPDPRSSARRPLLATPGREPRPLTRPGQSTLSTNYAAALASASNPPRHHPLSSSTPLLGAPKTPYAPHVAGGGEGTHGPSDLSGHMYDPSPATKIDAPQAGEAQYGYPTMVPYGAMPPYPFYPPYGPPVHAIPGPQFAPVYPGAYQQPMPSHFFYPGAGFYPSHYYPAPPVGQMLSDERLQSAMPYDVERGHVRMDQGAPAAATMNAEAMAAASAWNAHHAGYPHYAYPGHMMAGGYSADQVDAAAARPTGSMLRPVHIATSHNYPVPDNGASRGRHADGAMSPTLSCTSKIPSGILSPVTTPDQIGLEPAIAPDFFAEGPSASSWRHNTQTYLPPPPRFPPPPAFDEGGDRESD
ncbi:hypothetical protein BC828DRAFT_375797 [Blastocladiella britannica]|nr:hypothetical protein BC828DRAFT_375797 [Blastocladiella britannica]